MNSPEARSAFIIRLSPDQKQSVWKDHKTDRTIDYLGDQFIDVSDSTWIDRLPPHVRSIPRGRWLILFDDHHDHLKRLATAKQLGLEHILFDDNYIAGFGDSFSIKAACDGGKFSSELGQRGGETRRFFAKHSGRHFKRCEKFHRKCHTLSKREASEARSTLLDVIDVYWEMPPLTPLTLSSDDSHDKNFRQYWHVARWAEGPDTGRFNQSFTQEQLQVLVRNCRKPLIDRLEDAISHTQLSKSDLLHQAGDFNNMAYVHVRKGPSI